MKRFIKYYMLSLLVAFFNIACTDDLIVRNEENIREGVSVTVSLDFGVSTSKIVTRFAANEEIEQTVNRIYLFVFNSDGSLDNKQLYSINQSTTGCIETITNFPMHSGYDKRFYAIANPDNGSGNLSMSQLASIETEGELLSLTSSLQTSTNIDRTYFLMSGKMELAEGENSIDVTENGSIVGAAVCSNHNVPLIQLERVDARITFKIKGEKPSGKDYRNFSFKPDRYWVENIPQHTYVFAHDTDYENNADGVLNYESSYENDIQRYVEGQDENDYHYFEFYIQENRKQPNTFITAEALEDSRYEDVENLYALREQREKISLQDPNPNKPEQKYENGEFVFANPHSTYVMIHGILSYEDYTNPSSPTFVHQDATYTIHLGNTGNMNDSNNPAMVNDYATNRNTHYTYTVHVTGVNSIYVEVKEEEGAKETRPGIEGDLIMSSSDVRTLDAHYGRIYFTLRRADIRKGLSWAIKTHFQSGMKAFDANHFATNADGTLKAEDEYTDEEYRLLMTYLASDPNAPEGAVRLNDYKWVQFVINSEVTPSVGLGIFAKYPGYRAYDGGEGEGTPASPFGGDGYRNGNDYYKEDAVLYDVNQLMNHLYIEAYNQNSGLFVNPQTGNVDNNVNSDNAVVPITAFIDEYVYKYDPRTVYHENPDPTTHEDLLLWREVVNGESRMLHLCTSSNIYSEDGNSSLAENVLSITQNPIYTFYNHNDATLQTAWGTESINETGRLVVNVNDNIRNNWNKLPNTHKNGRQNTLNIIPTIGGEDSDRVSGWESSGLKWSDVMQRDVDAFGKLNEGYNNVWYACLGRNRDLDGDNNVDANEIRWYLAAIDQLTDIWIGENSLNEGARLYTAEVCAPHSPGHVRRHVASSTYYDGTDGSTMNSSNNPWVIWAEEGASVGSWNDSKNYNNGYRNGNGNVTAPENERNLYEYRCVRNLGLSLDDIDYDGNNEEVMEVENYVEASEVTRVTMFDKEYNERYISLPKLEYNSVRSASISGEDIQPAHNERDAENRPFRKFAVIVSEVRGTDDGIYPTETNERGDYVHTQNGSYSWSYYQNANNERNVCPRGYRIPNQRETMLLYTTYPDLYNIATGNENCTYYDSNSGNYHFYFMIKTAFSFDGYGLYENTRDGFSYDASWQTLNLLTTWNNGDMPPGKVRCVRDIVE